MATEVIMPKVDMVMETGMLVEWLKNEGDHVKKGDALFVINTDKAAIEVESPADGTLAGVTAQVGDVVPVTTVIAYILAAGESLPEKSPAPATAASVKAAGTPVVSEPAAVAVAVAGAAPVELGKKRASPVARRVAKELGLSLDQISGRGPRGRIHKADVLAFQKPQLTAEAPAAPSTAAFATVPAAPGLTAAIPLPDARRKQVVPLSGVRKIISERLAYSAFTAPHINLSLTVDMTEAVRLRERILDPIQKQTGQRVSYTAIVARAVASVLPRHPYLNASLSDGSIILWEDVHLGIAASVDDNLIVPVIREAQNRSMGQLVTALADLTERGRNRRLTPAEMSGSTFTITNLGMYGIESFTAIINPPESAILAVGKMVDTPVSFEGQLVFRPMMNLTVSADHRICDGATVAKFLAELKSVLENPYLLI